MISVVVPALNEEKLIGECLKSLQSQDFTGDYEIIVADNGSEDNTIQIALDMGVKVISCPDRGVSYARQAGTDAASGEIIIQVDADTVYPLWWLSRIQKHFTNHPRIVAVAGKFIYKNPPWWAVGEYFLRVVPNLLSSFFLGRPYIISGANFAFYKKALIQIGGYKPESYSSDQFNIAMRLSRIGKILYDSQLYCATSERSVDKPIYAILIAFIRNLSIFANYMLQGVWDIFKRRTKKASRASAGTYIKIIIPLLLMGVLIYGYFVPISPVFGKVYYRSITSQKVIALTFDDGPNEPYTSQILDILDKDNIQATFFAVGYNVSLYPDTTKRILEDGSVIGNHTYSHDANHALTFNAPRDIEMAQQTISEIAGVEPHLYRPPHGKKSPWELEAIKSKGFIEVLWNISTGELNGKSPEYMAEQIIEKARPGGIILLHDGYGIEHNNSNADKSDTVTMLPIIIRELQTEGYVFITVPELLKVPAYNRIS